LRERLKKDLRAWLFFIFDDLGIPLKMRFFDTATMEDAAQQSFGLSPLCLF
jgi:hypothetical protein